MKTIGKYVLAALLTVAAFLLPLGSAHAVPIPTVEIELEDFTNPEEGDFFAKVFLTDDALNKVTVGINIDESLNPGLTKGDILGLFFDVLDDSVLADLMVVAGSGSPMGVVTHFDKTGNVTSVGGPDNNINGLKDADGNQLSFDVGIGFLNDSQGKGKDDRSISFQLMGTGLSSASFLDQNVGLRVKPIEGTTLFTGGSSKLLNTSGGSTPVPSPGTVTLLGAGLVGLAFMRRRRSALDG